MGKKKFLVVGLGNPEGKYFNTYHNVGFVVAEKLCKDFKKKGNMLVGECDNAIVVKPLTYMNNSGQAVVAIARKLKFESQNIIIVYDDIYIDKGNVRVKFGGGAAGHNGIKSIIALLGTNDFYHIRVGIKPQKEPHSMANYVLSKISGDLAIDDAVQAVCDMLAETDFGLVQQKYNKTNIKE